MPTSRPLGELVATGNTSDVWRYSRRQVVKVLRPGIPADWATLEADITARVHDAGLPAPATEGVIEVNGRPGIVFEHLDGPSMWNVMKAEPSHQGQFMHQLVDIQLMLHEAAPIRGLPDLVTRLRDKIRQAVELTAKDRREAIAVLEELPRGDALCHGDMHPANILMSPRGPVVVDWFDAAAGNPVADLARSSLLMQPTSETGFASTFLEGATYAFLGKLHAMYLAALGRRGMSGGVSFDTWEAVIAAARVSEPVPPEYPISIWRRRPIADANGAASDRSNGADGQADGHRTSRIKGSKSDRLDASSSSPL